MSSNQNNRGLETIPFQIVNQSGLDAPLYIWIQGIIPDKKPNEYVFANDLKGNVADMPKSLTKATFSMLLPQKIRPSRFLASCRCAFTCRSANNFLRQPQPMAILSLRVAGALVIQFKAGITLNCGTISN
jgi:hypothetical protein